MRGNRKAGSGNRCHGAARGERRSRARDGGSPRERSGFRTKTRNERKRKEIKGALQLYAGEWNTVRHGHVVGTGIPKGGPAWLATVCRNHLHGIQKEGGLTLIFLKERRYWLRFSLAGSKSTKILY